MVEDNMINAPSNEEMAAMLANQGDQQPDGTPPMTDSQARHVTPLDLLDGHNYTTRDIRDSRLDTCMGCDRLFKLTKTCKECGCFMAMKTWLSDASCPLGKW